MKITLKLDQIEGLAQRLGTLSADGLGAFTVDAINETVDSAYELARNTMLSGINLTDEYIQRSMEVKHATAAKPEASITAFGSKAHITNLSHYGAMQHTRAVNWSNQRIIAERKPFGKAAMYGGQLIGGWTLRVGSAPLGIDEGKKAAGKSVEVVRGRRKSMKPVFSIPGVRDKDQNLILFSRDKNDKVRAKTGLSPYQLFAHAIPLIYDEVTDDLQDAMIEMAERELQKALT